MSLKVLVIVMIRAEAETGLGALPVPTVVFPPSVHSPPTRVHEEIGDCGEVEAKLLGDGDLHVFTGSLSLFENGLDKAEKNTKSQKVRAKTKRYKVQIKTLLRKPIKTMRKGRVKS